jgi:hypothetical protein
MGLIRMRGVCGTFAMGRALRFRSQRPRTKFFRTGMSEMRRAEFGYIRLSIVSP